MTKVVDVKNENLHVVIAVDRFKSKTSCQMQTIKWLVCFIEKVFSHALLIEEDKDTVRCEALV